MRISGGKAKGIILSIPKARKLRPVLEPARERLFSCLGELVGGASFLDLFAGTGSHGLEALSRGAARGAFVGADASFGLVVSARGRRGCGQHAGFQQ